MYISARTVEAHNGKMNEALTIVSWVIGQINERHGGDMSASIEIGGNPNALHVTGRWESLGAYQATRAAYMADAEIMAAVNLASNVATMVQDRMAQILRAPGERAEFSAVNFAEMDLTAIVEAIPFVVEVAEKASSITGHETGVIRATTGLASTVAWVTFADSLQTLQDSDTKLNSDPEFLDFYKRSATCMVAGSLVQTLRQRVA